MSEKEGPNLERATNIPSKGFISASLAMVAQAPLVASG
jgi:hypothetical protein